MDNKQAVEEMSIDNNKAIDDRQDVGAAIVYRDSTNEANLALSVSARHNTEEGRIAAGPNALTRHSVNVKKKGKRKR